MGQGGGGEQVLAEGEQRQSLGWRGNDKLRMTSLF